MPKFKENPSPIEYMDSDTKNKARVMDAETGSYTSSPAEKRSSFKLRSGNSPLYKNLGSSPMKDHMNRPHEHVSEHVYTVNDPKTREKVTLSKDPKGRGYKKGESTVIKKEKIRSTLPTVEVKGKKKEREEET